MVWKELQLKGRRFGFLTVIVNDRGHFVHGENNLISLLDEMEIWPGCFSSYNERVVIQS